MAIRGNDGVGSQIKRWLWVAKLWPASKTCKCNRLVGQMNKAGPAQVRANLEYWVGEMKTSADSWFTEQGLPIRIPVYVLRKVIQKACDVVEERPAPWAERTTVCITHYKRPADLERLLASIPNGIRVLTQDTEGNLSRGRNQLMKACDTDFAIIMEEDMVWRSDTDPGRLVQVLQHDKAIAFAGGRIVDERMPWRHNFEWLYNGTGRPELGAQASGDPWKRAGDTIYQPCDLVSNFGAVRTEFARDCPWDERFELGEHRDWFLSLRKRRKRAAFVPQSRIDHYSSRPTDEYRLARSRAKSFWPGVQDKHNVTLKQPTHPHHGLNVVVLGVGFSNTTITTRQLQALGWDVGEVSNDFCEHTLVSDINWRLSEGFVPQEEIDAALANLRQPWVIKDPKFRETLERWLPAFVPYQPILLYLTKDSGTVKDSYLRRDQPTDHVDARIRNCERMFWLWPWPKMKVDATQIASAVKLFDLRITPPIEEEYDLLGISED
jgi:hypothetical protein